ncbi:hypothetical protein [Desulfogranum marinum]|uniref:hypothetical protein n=1 Tax=Desulfogranum marinum TaxID=453220 RepID=UPI0029C8D8C8|nr:hypothetical protein [Desulfogranum marinum]
MGIEKTREQSGNLSHEPKNDLSRKINPMSQLEIQTFDMVRLIDGENAAVNLFFKIQAGRLVFNSISSPKYSSFSRVIRRFTVMLLTQREWRGALTGNIAVLTRKKKRRKVPPYQLKTSRKIEAAGAV